METVWRFLKTLKTELPCDPAIPLLGIYLKKTKTNLKRYMHPKVGQRKEIIKMRSERNEGNNTKDQ